MNKINGHQTTYNNEYSRIRSLLMRSMAIAKIARDQAEELHDDPLGDHYMEMFQYETMTHADKLIEDIKSVLTNNGSG